MHIRLLLSMHYMGVLGSNVYLGAWARLVRDLLSAGRMNPMRTIPSTERFCLSQCVGDDFGYNHVSNDSSNPTHCLVTHYRSMPSEIASHQKAAIFRVYMRHSRIPCAKFEFNIVIGSSWYNVIGYSANCITNYQSDLWFHQMQCNDMTGRMTERIIGRIQRH